MGWDFTKGQTREGLIRELVMPWGNGTRQCVCLVYCWKGNRTQEGRLWSVRELQQKDETGTVVKTERMIAVDLCEFQPGYGWGYKGMDESVGPCYYDCPLAYLDMVPQAEGPYAQAWREKVRAYHAQRKGR
jgi:hypothetical protein